MRASARVREHVDACACAWPCLSSMNGYAPCCDVICDPPGSNKFFDCISKTALFSGKKVTEHKMCVSIFSTNFV
jgi:hypothetical protein